MDNIKKLAGKNPVEYALVAKNLIDNSDVDLYTKLVKQDDFLFDFIKNNVAKRLQQACNKDNYLNIFNFFKIYSPSYDTMFAEVLYKYGGVELIPRIKDIFNKGSNAEKTYALKFFTFIPPKYIEDITDKIRIFAKSEDNFLSTNAIEVLSYIKDDISKNEAIKKLNSKDEFEQYEGVKFLVTYQARDCFDLIANLMKTSTMSENIAYELLYLANIEEILKENFDLAILLLCNIINAIPEIVPVNIILDYNFYNIFEQLYLEKLNSISAVLLILAKDKFEELISNEEYLYDCDNNTKEEIKALNELLKGVNKSKLQSLLYDEVYEDSDFVMFAVDYVNEVEVLEGLLDSENQTLILKVLSILKNKLYLTKEHKSIALKNISNDSLKKLIEAM